MSPIISSVNQSFGFATTSPKIVTNGLVLYLDAGQSTSYNGGTTWRDLSGRGNNGTLTNGPTYSSANGGSIVFDGVNDYGIIADSSDFTVTATTVCAWFNASVLNDASYSSRGLVSSYDDSGRQYYGLRVTAALSNNKFQTYYDDNAGYGFKTLQGITILNENQWYYGCMTWKSGTFHRTYLNGVQEAEETNVATTTLNISTAFYIGNDFAGSTTYFNGNIAQASIYNRALTATEIQQNFQALRGRFNI